MSRPSIELIRENVKQNSYSELRWAEDDEPVILDLFTASAMVQVYDALKPENQTKFAAAISRSEASFFKVHSMVLKCLK